MKNTIIERILLISCLSLITIIIISVILTPDKPYPFNQSKDRIVSIEIVYINDIFDYDYTVLKVLSDTEITEFLEEFENIYFAHYYIGDLMYAHGNAFKVTYENGYYELICHFWSNYIEDDDVYSVRKSCDEEVFSELINSFLK